MHLESFSCRKLSPDWAKQKIKSFFVTLFKLTGEWVHIPFWSTCLAFNMKHKLRKRRVRREIQILNLLYTTINILSWILLELHFLSSFLYFFPPYIHMPKVVHSWERNWQIHQLPDPSIPTAILLQRSSVYHHFHSTSNNITVDSVSLFPQPSFTFMVESIWNKAWTLLHPYISQVWYPRLAKDWTVKSQICFGWKTQCQFPVKPPEWPSSCSSKSINKSFPLSLFFYFFPINHWFTIS